MMIGYSGAECGDLFYANQRGRQMRKASAFKLTNTSSAQVGRRVQHQAPRCGEQTWWGHAAQKKDCPKVSLQH
jgi:hypothetical protein